MRALSRSTLDRTRWANFAGRHLGGVDLLDAQRSGSQQILDGQADGPGPGVDGAAALVEGEDDRVVAAPRRRHGEGECERRLADAGGADEQGVRAALQAASEERIHLAVAALREVPEEALVMLGRDQARIDLEPAPTDGGVVVAALELDATHLDHAQPTALGTEVDRVLLQQDDPVGKAVQGDVPALRGEVVQEQHGAALGREEVLQRHDLTAIPNRALREDPHLGKTVEDDACRLDRLDPVHDRRRGLAQFDRGGLEHRQLVVRVEARLRGGEIEQPDAVERPSVAFGDQLQFRAAFRQADMQRLLAEARTFEENWRASVVLPLPGCPSTR